MEARTLKIPNHLQQVYVTIFFKKGYVFNQTDFERFFFSFSGSNPITYLHHSNRSYYPIKHLRNVLAITYILMVLG